MAREAKRNKLSTGISMMYVYNTIILNITLEIILAANFTI